MENEDSRQRSAEIFRLVVGFMGRQQAGFYPESYRLWYEHAAGINPPLSRVLEERLAASSPLTDADVRQLYLQHIVPREREAVERAQERLLTLMREASQALSQSGIHAAQLEETLGGHSQRLRTMPSLETIQDIIREILTETENVCAANRSLAQQLDQSAKEVVSLTHHLERAQAEAINDPLTGLLNRRGFEQAVGKAYSSTTELSGAALLIADLDRFKEVNDSHGHLVGDQVLRAVAQVLRSRIKGEDIAARLGGDEFAVLMPDTPLAGAMALAEQIRAKVLQGRLRLSEGDKTVGNITISIGVAHADGGLSLEALLQRADSALYAAKTAGRNCISSAAAEPGGK